MRETLVAPSYNTNGKKKLQKKTKNLINTNAQFVILNKKKKKKNKNKNKNKKKNNKNNNKLYTLLNYAYWNLPWKATSVY